MDLVSEETLLKRTLQSETFEGDINNPLIKKGASFEAPLIIILDDLN
jgi:hypothetical protein